MSDPKTTAWIRQQIANTQTGDASAAANACVRLIDAAATLRGNTMGSVFGLTTSGSDVLESTQLADECLAVVAQFLPTLESAQRQAVERALVTRGFRVAAAAEPWGVAEVTLSAEIQDYEEGNVVGDTAAWARWNGSREAQEHLLRDVLGLPWILDSRCRLRVTDQVEGVMTFALLREPTEAELVALRSKVDAVLFQSWGLNTEFEPLTEDDDLTHTAVLKRTNAVHAFATKQ